MITMDFLYQVYLETRQNKRRSEDSVEFEIELEKNLEDLLESINNKTFIADGNYTFITTNPGRNGCREVFAAELGTRVVHHYIHRALLDILEDELTPRTYNNRIGKGVIAAVQTVRDDIYEVTNGYTEDAWIIKWDLKAFFMCIKHDIIFEKLMHIIDERYKGDDIDDLKWMIERCIFSHPAEHCYRKSPTHKWMIVEPHKSLFNQPEGQGAAIGFLIWQLFINYYHDDIDRWIYEELHIPFARFVDDMLIIVKDKDAALAYIMPELRKRYADLNITMQDKKFYCQHYSKGVKFCGMTVKFDRIYPNPRTVRSVNAKIDKFNRQRVKYVHLQDFLNSMNSYLGIIKQCTSYRLVNKLISRIDIGWFNYVQWDPVRRVLSARPCYDFHGRLDYSYNLGLTTFNKHKSYIGKPIFNAKYTKIVDWDINLPPMKSSYYVD